MESSRLNEDKVLESAFRPSGERTYQGLWGGEEERCVIPAPDVPLKLEEFTVEERTLLKGSPAFTFVLQLKTKILVVVFTIYIAKRRCLAIFSGYPPLLPSWP